MVAADVSALAGTRRKRSRCGTADRVRGRRRITGKALQRVHEALHVHGFGEIAFHSCGKKAFPVADHGIGRQGHDGNPGPVGEPGVGPDDPGRLEAVHVRHLHIHENQVEGLPLQDLQRIPAVLGLGDDDSPLFDDQGNNEHHPSQNLVGHDVGKNARLLGADGRFGFSVGCNDAGKPPHERTPQ